MAHTPEEYAYLLRNLLPPGQAFRRDPGTNLETFLRGLAIELSRVEARSDQLPIEVTPSTTTELLAEWEAVAGLPDKCSGRLEDTLQGRRNALMAKLSSVGGQSKAYFIEVAKQLGYDITITEFRPFRAGMSRAGDALTNTDDWVFAWRVNSRETTVISFRAGLSAAGEPLRSWGNSALECKITQLSPAHTYVFFAYGAIELEALLQATDEYHFAIHNTLPENLNNG